MKKMFLAIIQKFKKHKYAFIISIVLFILPFFWLKPDEMDLGGDANRLYFYDPVAFLESTALYAVAREGRGAVDPRFFYFPYVASLAFLNLFFHSATYLISFLNAIKISIGFLAVYFITVGILNNIKSTKLSVSKASGIFAGLFYLVSFGSMHMAFFWDRALFTHDQIFLNPLIFYLLFNFFQTHKYSYLYVLLLFTFIFSTNFSLLGSAPPLFAFYPIALLFLVFYTYFFGKKGVPWKGLIIGFIFFLGLHSFHLVAEINSFVDTGSPANSIVFSKQGIENEGVTYFNAVSHHGQAVLNFLLPSDNMYLRFTSLLFPVLLIVGCIVNRKNKKFNFILLFFFLTFFLVTANITTVGLETYKKFFYIPGFAMFRNFYTQWMYIYIFFYALILGMSVYSISITLRTLYRYCFFSIIFSFVILTGIPLFLGWPINKALIRASENVSTITKMDPRYEQTLQYIRQLPNDGKIIVFPLTDVFRQVVAGKEGGAYEGPSTLLGLTNKYSFVGYQHFGYKDVTPYAEDLMQYAREKDYKKMLSLFTTLNIRYILHNSDPNAYEKSFTPGSYGYMMTAFPTTQSGYKEFLTHFPLRTVYQNGAYTLYEIDNSFYNPTIYIPQGIYESNQLLFDEKMKNEVFLSDTVCKNVRLVNLCNKNYQEAPVELHTTMINPTHYSIVVTKKDTVSDLFFVLQHTFHNKWKIRIDKRIPSDVHHFTVNGYANGWYVEKKDIPSKDKFIIEIYLDSQKYFWYGWGISIPFLLIISILLVITIKKSK